MIFDDMNQMKKQLGQLDAWLAAARTYADQRKFDVNQFMQIRLIVDQLSFAQQIQIACDTLKLGASRMTGKDAPKHDDSEKTIADLRKRIAETQTYLDGCSAKDYEASPTRTITTPRWEGKTMTGADYFREHVQPNFFFHLTHAYAILRQNGVPIGKRDYLGALTQTAPKS